MAQAIYFDRPPSAQAMPAGHGLGSLASASAWSIAWDRGADDPSPAQVQANANAQRRAVAGNGAPTSRGGAPVAGGMSVELNPEDINGVWSLRFGAFGCPDSEMRGGVVHVEDGVAVGGDSHFAYLGHWTLRETELTASLEVTRHSDDPEMATLFGSNVYPYRLDCVAEAITPDLFEGRIRRAGFPDVRLTMRRLSFLPS